MMNQILMPQTALANYASMGRSQGLPMRTQLLAFRRKAAPSARDRSSESPYSRASLLDIA